MALLFVGLAFGTLRFLDLVRHVRATQWASLAVAGGATLARVLGATALGTLWALPVGLAIGLSPKLMRIAAPITQLLASFPAPILFPAAIVVLSRARVPLDFGSVLLMLLGTQWYILFNVTAAAASIPGDLAEAMKSYGLPLRKRITALYLPAVFPSLVTGWVTAAGGAWNASIVSEYVSFRGQEYVATGLGKEISSAAARADFPTLAAAVTSMSLLVVLFNRAVWQTLYRIAEQRFAVNR
jgi:NitT/TauT family transport system permease protein